ncbi:ADP-ribosylglycohydrolase [Anaerosphaera aminiphila DSM 21120]|uniref:ADP-ribosylglycohydrolase n=1 Tax=Anaerosphaera aminiphila DSM 21120 TaxID=1120995 RepID=A0A1M5QW42_9FIRM|nr:ADP-ribosylglycohydrolase family protein [Anaerosphaera aminiphila]SHH17929.1 ADP-ribosylglycohydrolase [Anaerosphaera aminiphila DSM 21120]
MYGAIIGDIIGSAFERSGSRIKTKNFELFSKNSKPTDDSYMTVAVAKAILLSKGNREKFKVEVVRQMRFVGRAHLDCGFGSNFIKWIESENMGAYGSIGNGSAMRVSPVGNYFKDIKTVSEYAKISSEVSHNTEDSIIGAEAVASAVYLAKNKKSKAEIKCFIEKNYNYNLNKTVDEIRPSYEFNATARGSVSEGIISFLDAEDFEDAIRNAVSLGGDSDTLAAIAGSVAENYFGIPPEFIKKANKYFSRDILEVIFKFYEVI